MKKFVIVYVVLLIVSMLTGCRSKDDRIKEAVTSYIASRMKNPESLKILSMEIRKEPVPLYLTLSVVEQAKETTEAFDEYEKYADMSYLWAEEKAKSQRDLVEAHEKLEKEYEAAKNETEDIKHIVYVKSSGTNSMGGTISSSFIVILDDKNPTDILGLFKIDKDFLRQYVMIKTLCEGFEFKKNKFGKYETEGLSYTDQFIINETE